MKRSSSRSAFVVAILASLVCACSTYRGVEPVYPRHGETLGELRPVFEWEPAAADGVRYDLVILDGAAAKDGGLADPVYRREGLSEPRHALEIDLKPNHEYSWAVRTRSEKGVSSWNSHQFVIFVGLGFHRSTRSVQFSTPSPEDASASY